MTDCAYDRMADVFAALAAADRLRLLSALSTGERSVGELAETTGLKQAPVSKHLAVLANAGILTRRRDGQRVLYSVADPAFLDLCHAVCGRLKALASAQVAAIEAFTGSQPAAKGVARKKKTQA